MVDPIRSPNPSTANPLDDDAPPCLVPPNKPPGDPSLDGLYERLMDQRSTYGLTYVNQCPEDVKTLAAMSPRNSERVVRAKLDDFMAKASGPYTVQGQVVAASPQFRLNGGFDGASPEAKKTLARVAAHAGVSPEELAAVRKGIGSVGTVRKLTQALLDAGRLPAGNEPLPDRVRRMMWEHGIGIDCASYVRQAFASVHPWADRNGVALRLDLSGLAGQPGFAPIAATDVRAGDLWILKAPSHEIWGHTAIVYSHVVADDARLAQLAAQGVPPPAELVAGRRVHIYEVDSSWGAGPDGDPNGGVQRRTWIHNEENGTWGYYLYGTWSTSKLGPYSHETQGIYRLRSRP